MLTNTRRPVRKLGTSTNHHANKGLLAALRLAIVAAAVTALVIGLALPSYAMSVTNKKGYPGTVVYGSAYVYDVDLGMGLRVDSHLQSPSLTINESPQYSSQAQRVCATTVIWRYNEWPLDQQWHRDTTSTVCKTIAASSTAVTVHGWDTLMDWNLDVGYRVQTLVKWYNTADQFLGQKQYNYDAATDYQCQLSVLVCHWNANIGYVSTHYN